MNLLTAVVMASAAMSWPSAPPPPTQLPVTDDYYGQRLVDRYRYFENLADPRVRRFFRVQANYTNAMLARLGPERERLRADVKRLLDAGASVAQINRVGQRIFYLERPVGANDERLMVRDAPGTTPRLLLDPVALQSATGSKAHLSISFTLPAPDGAHVAVGVVPGGAEPQTHTRVIDTATGRLLPDDLPRTWFGALAWSSDGQTLFYNQLPELKVGESENDRELRSMAYSHRLGTSMADAPVFGIGLNPNVPFAPIDQPILTLSPVSPYAIGVVGHGVQNEATLYVAPTATLGASATIPWRKVADVDDAVTSFDISGSTLYLLTHKNASRYKVTSLDMSRTDETAANASTVVPASDMVIQQIAVARDGLYVRGIVGGLARLRKVPLAGGTASDVRLPFDGTLGEFATDPREPGAVLGLTSWTKPLLVYTLDAGGGLADTGIKKSPAIDTSQYTSLEVQATSADGTRVPVSIVMRRGTKLNGSNPTYLTAYGAYGIDADPTFLGPYFALLDAGGIFAVAHVRGGGENGTDWYLGGKGPTKQHTIDDGVAAARYLVTQHYTTAKHLAIEGTSAGGIMVGGAVTQHPELFAAAIDVVGLTDILRSEAADPNGTTNVPEFGSVNTHAGFKGLYVMDAYQHVVDGKPYPALMAVTGINDPRVAPWHPAKFAARVAAASSSGRPVLLRVDYDAGHGNLAASVAQRVALTTDEFSFVLWQCGSPLFANIPQRRAALRE